MAGLEWVLSFLGWTRKNKNFIKKNALLCGERYTWCVCWKGTEDIKLNNIRKKKEIGIVRSSTRKGSFDGKICNKCDFQYEEETLKSCSTMATKEK